MNIAGLDISSFAVDVVLLDEETDDATWHRFRLDGSTPFERTRSLRGVFPSRSFWEDNAVFLAAVEDPVGHHAHTAKALGLVTGGVAALLPRDLIAVQTQPSEWKRIFCGRGNATKEDIVAACHRHGFDSRAGAPAVNVAATRELAQDAYDAYGIAWAVRALNNEAIQRGAA
jgi:hypothetical protein